MILALLFGGMLQVVDPFAASDPWRGTFMELDHDDGPEVIVPVPRSGTSIERFPNYLGGESVTRPDHGDRIDCYPSVLGGTKCVVQ